MQSIQRSKPEKPPIELASDELAALDEGIRSAKEDRRYTLDEALDFAKKRREQWLKVPKAASA